jgi:hypothetical protein
MNFLNHVQFENKFRERRYEYITGIAGCGGHKYKQLIKLGLKAKEPYPGTGEETKGERNKTKGYKLIVL